MFKHVLLATALIAAVPAGAVELITNGGFETGDFTGWTVKATNGTAVIAATPYAGSFDAKLQTGSGQKSLTQSVVTTAGSSYQLTYYLKNTGKAADSLIVTAGDSAMSFADRPAFGYTQFTQAFHGDAGSTAISFFYKDKSPGFFQIDDVSVSAIPEPATWGLFLVGLGLVGSAARQRRRFLAA